MRCPRATHDSSVHRLLLTLRRFPEAPRRAIAYQRQRRMPVLLLMAATLLASQSGSASGDVVDPAGLALPGVVVTVRGTTAVAVTDEHGRFTIDVGSTETQLIFALSGFATRTIAVTPGTSSLHVVMTIAPVSSEVVVRAPATVAPPDARMALRPLDVVRTAGTQADMMRALALLPGVAQVDE